MLYDELFLKLERVRWSLADDIPWDDIQPERISAQELEHVRYNCLTELSSLYAEEMFIRDFYDDVDFCQFISIWYYEEMKHYLVLREYLKRFGMEPGEEEVNRCRMTFAPGKWEETLAMHFVGEQRLGMWYSRWADSFREPVIKKIYQTIAEDEFRHASAYFEYMKRAVARNPLALKGFLRAALFMLRNAERDKHPTSIKVNGPDEPSVIDKLEGSHYIREMVEKTVSLEDERKTEKRILSLLSSLVGQPLSTIRDLVSVMRVV